MFLRRIGLAGPLWVLVAAALPGLAQDENLEDILGGFDEEDPGFEVDREAIAETRERWWDLSGSVEISASLNIHSHESAAGTDYGGLQRLRNRLNLQFDADLPSDWKARVEGWFFYDLAYLLNGRGRYTEQVRNEYELDWELREVYLQGSLHERVDLKAGRQIVIWGRSESLRVLDVLNPLDNREPGRVDLEDLRRPLGMLRLDAYVEDWTFTALAIPEIRFDLGPVFGSDFLPVATPAGLAPERKPDSLENWELAGAATGTFSGWDLSLHGAWFFADAPRLDRARGGRNVHDRLWMLGTGGNYTLGAWLFKGELALLDGFAFDPRPGAATGTASRSRIDALVGVEYYGWVDTTLTLEVVNRFLLGHDGSVRRALSPQPENQQEVALRVTRTSLHERLEITALGVLLSQDAADAAILFRLSADYDLRDALVLSGGILIFQEGDFSPLDTWGQNDRLFFGLKWSF